MLEQIYITYVIGFAFYYAKVKRLCLSLKYPVAKLLTCSNV